MGKSKFSVKRKETSMHKELIISLLIIVGIVGLNKLTQDNTDKTVEIVSNQLEIVKAEILKEEPEHEQAKMHIQNAYDKWEELDDIMAYYVEHDELEKTKTALTSIRSFIEIKDYGQAIESLDRCVYILQHIELREKLTLDNIF